MARSELLVDLVEAEGKGDRERFRRLVEVLIAEERSKRHHLVADRISELISTSGSSRLTQKDAHKGAAGDLITEIPGRQLGHRERSKRETRSRLSEVAFRLFVERGYDATTVEMIAAGAGVTARTFFRYFDTKDSVVLEPGSRLIAAAAQRLADLPPSDRQLLVVAEVITDLLVDEDFFRQVRKQVRGAPSSPHLRKQAAIWRQQWATELANQLATLDGRGGPSLSERAVCKAALAVTGTVLDEWFRLGGRADVRVLMREAVAAVCPATDGVQEPA